MTYNFDPDRWYENEYDALKARRGEQDLSAEEFDRAVEELFRRYEEMTARLDGTYQLPGGGMTP
jgi:hypothetical protein